ncbi:DUF2330 domain-containing protein [Pseudenhygromyxa sp. WMMC2535]|uniref:DUF2330 domain-containing protein n=1 Tax=Pseudenhygromyxa sp. WMMC2535 TaxID=2712867 RepID=UPI0015536BA4|nr:DUF2330 domain-containing protein [Pseudenhygromyxa sp. WMMC2535]NVB37868.1 DUF2330 domain-containing protein [Pseudenhygromyxa sp. WMMC2535]
MCLRASVLDKGRRWARVAAVACGLSCLAPATASAFCGFYVAGAGSEMFNDATVVVLMRDGKRTVISMQNNYQGPPEGFAMVVPVPTVLGEDDVRILRSELFERVDTLSAPRLVEYWERDPCELGGTIGLGNLGLIGKGAGGGGVGYGRGSGGHTVVVEAEFAVGEYEIVILSARESSGLEAWLRENDYAIPEGAEPLLRPYVQQGMKFFVAKVDPKKVKFENGRATLSPLRFHYDSDQFSLPVRLGLINAPDPESGGKQDLIVHILAPRTRYEVANYPKATIPTNLDVKPETAEHFGEFYVSLFDHTLAEAPRAVVTEYAWSAGGCDPCPGPDAALTAKELLEFGGDVLPSWSDELSKSSVAVARVRPGKPEVSGGLAEDIVRRIVRAHINEVRACYNDGLSKGQALAGTLGVDFEIDALGEVSKSELVRSTLKDEDVGACVAKRIERWRFPKPKGGGVVTVSQGFDLTGGMGGPLPATASSFVLTRLHARYDAEGLGEDLVFEAAPALIGGRELMDSAGELERGARLASEANYGFVTNNNFQARYAIRHEWTGEIACESPQRGRWGGPPAQGDSSETVVARQLTGVSRGGSLGSFITAGASAQLGVTAVAGPPSTPDPPAEDAKKDAPASAAADDSEAAKAPGEPELEGGETPGAKGCTCASEARPGSAAGLGGLGLLALVGFGQARRRRRRRGP